MTYLRYDLDRKNGFMLEMSMDQGGDPARFKYCEMKNGSTSIFMKRQGQVHEHDRFDALNRTQTGDFLIQVKDPKTVSPHLKDENDDAKQNVLENQLKSKAMGFVDEIQKVRKEVISKFADNSSHDKIATDVELQKKFSSKNPQLSAFFSNSPKDYAILKVSGSIYERIDTFNFYEYVKCCFPNKVKYEGWMDGRDMSLNKLGTLYTPSGFEYKGHWEEGFLSLDTETLKEYRAQIEKEIEKMFSNYVREDVTETKFIHSREIFQEMTKAQISQLLQNREMFEEKMKEQISQLLQNREKVDMSGDEDDVFSLDNKSDLLKVEKLEKSGILNGQNFEEFDSGSKNQVNKPLSLKSALSNNLSIQNRINSPISMKSMAEETPIDQKPPQKSLNHSDEEKLTLNQAFLKAYGTPHKIIMGHLKDSPVVFSTPQSKLEFTNYSSETKKFLDVYRSCNYKYFGVEVNSDFSTIRIGKFKSPRRINFVGILYTHLDKSNTFLYGLIPPASMTNNKDFNKNFCIFASPKVVQIRDLYQKEVKVTMTSSKIIEKQLNFGDEKTSEFADRDINSSEDEGQSRYPEDEEDQEDHTEIIKRIKSKKKNESSNVKGKKKKTLKKLSSLKKKLSLEKSGNEEFPSKSSKSKENDNQSIQKLKKLPKHSVSTYEHFRIHMESQLSNINHYSFTTGKLADEVDMRKMIDRFKFNGPTDDEERVSIWKDFRYGTIRHKFWDGGEFEGQIADFQPCGLGTFWDRKGWGFKGVWQNGILIELLQCYKKDKHSGGKIKEVDFSEPYWSIRYDIEQSNKKWVYDLLDKSETIEKGDFTEYFDGNMKNVQTDWFKKYGQERVEINGDSIAMEEETDSQSAESCPKRSKIRRKRPKEDKLKNLRSKKIQEMKSLKRPVPEEK